ncbi:lipopolysaccharide-modifying enzyme [Aspergillus japonicus CBS 114.51]|uniref:Lipopolysaccharide-modifying enzyme n=1 Tax=Aspergillus japonicus CBS 114.51 TaxID=1448312 RepID=A0A8T8X5T2_ASPJA|nr:lipopolysaccharide-modifying enzyme [Aspergillus japonicus CBS 114.51]RAH83527.1 lipopolysaccharide-modifying enzyme [Aspergillus japonicus CBS 114.51]
MRSQRLVVWLGTFILVSIVLIFVRSSNSSPDTSSFSPLPDPRPSANSQRPEVPPNEQLLQQSTYHKASTPAGKHPIAALSEAADQEWDQVRSRQSKTLSQAVQEYRRRYGMHPPPHFDKWFRFAQSKGVHLIDEYDTVYHSLLPFWALKPKTIRGRARETLGFDNSMIGVLIRNGTVTLAEGGTEEQKWQRSATVQMIKSFAEYLPDMDLVFNAHDEPRVIVPSEDLQRLVTAAREHAIPDASLTETPKNAWSDRPSDLNKGDRIDEVRTTRFSRFSHQSTWSYSRSSCPVDSPVRSLDEEPLDNIDSYAQGELGFIANTTAFSDICNTPSLKNTYGFFDRPNTFEVVHDLFPVFSQSKISSYQDILYPSPWYYADKVPYEAAQDVNWDAKLDKMYWRGSTTGGYSRAGGWRRQHRQLFVRNVIARDTAEVLAKQEDGKWSSTEIDRSSLDDLFDIQFTYIGQCDAEDCAAQKEYFGVAEPVDQQDAWAYRHLVDIDGNAFSGRFYAFLRSKSLVYKIAIFREWHDEWLKPWVHYVPLRLTGDDYLEAVRYFVEDEDGKHTASKIAQTSHEWAHRALRSDDMEVWFFRLLLEYGRLVDDNRGSLGFSL